MLVSQAVSSTSSCLRIYSRPFQLGPTNLPSTDSKHLLGKSLRRAVSSATPTSTTTRGGGEPTFTGYHVISNCALHVDQPCSTNPALFCIGSAHFLVRGAGTG